MAINNESLNRKLYGLLKVKGYNPVPKDSKGQTTPVPDEAEVFKFTFTRGGKAVGDVWITIDSSQNLVVYYDDEVADDDENTGAGATDFNDSWTGLIQHLKNWAQRRQLSFELKNKNHLSSDMAQRAHMKKEEGIHESAKDDSTPLTEAQNMQQKYLQVIRKYKLIPKIKELVVKLQKRAARDSDPDMRKMYAGDARNAMTVLRNLQRGNIRGARIAFARQDTAARDEYFKARYDGGWQFTQAHKALAVVLGVGLNTGNYDDDEPTIDQFLKEKAVSKAQQKFMGMVHAAQKGGKAASPEVAKVAKSMGKKDAKDFASTKHKGLPNKVSEATRSRPFDDIPRDGCAVKGCDKDAKKGSEYCEKHTYKPKPQKEKRVDEALHFSPGAYPNVDHMNGPSAVNSIPTIPATPSSSKRQYADKAKWGKDINEINSALYDDTAEYISTIKGTKVNVDGRTIAEWNNAAQKGWIDAGTMTEGRKPKYPSGKGCICKGNKASDNCPVHGAIDEAKMTPAQHALAEGYYPMGKKASYTDAVPSVKIVIQHSRQIEEGEQRFRNIAKIFLENTNGERILAPTIKPGIARIYARHLAEGGLPHNERWNHIGALVEEYTKMAGFVRATRSNQFKESAQKLVQEGLNHYSNLRETLNKLTTHRGYNEYFESWTPVLTEESESDTTLNELFVQEKLDPRIECVMPILSKLHKRVTEMSEVSALAEWADEITEDPLPPMQPLSKKPKWIKSDSKWVDKKSSKISQLEATLEKAGYQRIKDPAGNEYQYKWVKQGEPTYVVNYRFGAKGYEHAWREDGGRIQEEESLTSNNPQGIPEANVTEGKMAEADGIIQDILNGEREIYYVMNHPKNKVEQYVASILTKMYDEIAAEHYLHPDDDFEKIEARMMDQLEKDYWRAPVDGYGKTLNEAPVDRTEFNTWEEFKKGVADRGYTLEEPYADGENGPSPNDPYESTLVLDHNGDYIGMFWHEGEATSQGVIFNTSEDFQRWSNEGDMVDADTPDGPREPSDDMDGDFDTGMRDAGMGTDEDYGTPADEMFESIKKLAGVK
jgi:Protein of unknwon function (DUF3008)